MPTAGARRHEAFQKQVSDHYVEKGFEVYSLATRERADLLLVDPWGGALLVEIKSSRKGNTSLSHDQAVCAASTALPYLRIRPGKKGTFRVRKMNGEVDKEITINYRTDSGPTELRQLEGKPTPPRTGRHAAVCPRLPHGEDMGTKPREDG